MNSQKGFTLTLVLVGTLLLMALAAGLIYWGKASLVKNPAPVAVASPLPVESVLPSPTEAASATPGASVDETVGWKSYSKDGVTFEHPSDAVIISDTVDNEIHARYINVKSNQVDLTVSIDANTYDPGTQGADRIWNLNLNGVTWNARYDQANKCNGSCPAQTLYTAKIGGHNVGYLFRGEAPRDELISYYLSHFKIE